MITAARKPGREALWIVLLLLQASLSVFLIADQRLQRDREARDYYEIQRDVLSEAARGGPGSVPAWAQGRAALFTQGSLLQNALHLVARPLSGWNFLPLFYLGLFVDELIFLLGVWLLARRFFSDPRSAFFVTVAALGSSLWVNHPWMNFRIFYALPLTIHLARRFLNTGSPWTLAAVLNLQALQALGSPPGLFFMTPVAAALVLAGTSLILNEPAREAWKSIRWSRRHSLAALAGLAAWIPVAVVAYSRADGPLRSEPGSFGGVALAFAGLDAPACLLDLVLGIAPTMDSTLFCGFFTLGFAILGFARLDPKKSLRLLGAAAAGIVLLSLLAALSFRCFPSLHGARPSAAGAPLLRLIFVFLAGAGFDAALQRRPAPRNVAGSVAAGLLVLAVALVAVSSWVQHAQRPVHGGAAVFAPQRPEALSRVFQTSVLAELLDSSALGAALAGGGLLLLHSRARTVPLAIALILFLHPLELFGWKFRITWLMTIAADARTAQEQRLPTPPASPGASLRSGGLVESGCLAFLGLNSLAWISWTLGRAGRFQVPAEQEVRIG